MSRIGKKLIDIKEGVNVKIEGRKIEVRGPQGSLMEKIPAGLKVEIRDQQVSIKNQRPKEKKFKALHGLIRSLIANMVKGVSEGFTKTLKLVGTGYRVSLEGDKLVFSLGFSHPIEIVAPEGIRFEVQGNDTVVVCGIDKSLVGQIAARIRNFRPPEPYKGKGIRYQDEQVRKKAGKAKAGGVGTAGTGGEK
jgi:large subunit ribosomal protein L6